MATIDGKFQFKGTVTKQKIIKATDPTLVYVELQTTRKNDADLNQTPETINAIIARNALTFMLEVVEGDTITIYGHYNKQKQFVIERYLTSKKFDRIQPDLPSHLRYPHKKSDT